MRKVLNVTKVGFNGQTGDNRSPESLPFPACMASLLEAIGAPSPTREIHAHDTVYTKRVNNDTVLAASGMAFGLLWSREYCMSALDLMQVGQHREVIRRAFGYLGYSYKLLDRQEMGADMVKRQIVASIDAGRPALVFALFDPPECAIVAGYDDDGDTLIGWSHFQEGQKTEANGMFRVENWQNSGWWMFVVPDEKIAPMLDARDVLQHGLDILRMTEGEGYDMGQAAYAQWLAALEGDGKGLFNFHRSLLFSLAELRCWGSNFLRDAGVCDAADCFQKIHDLCWEMFGKANNEQAFAEAENRLAVAAVLREIAKQDEQAALCIEAFLKEHA